MNQKNLERDRLRKKLANNEAELEQLQHQQQRLENRIAYTKLTPLEKNQLWKLVMKKATAYRSQEDVLTVKIYPNLPK